MLCCGLSVKNTVDLFSSLRYASDIEGCEITFKNQKQLKTKTTARPASQKQNKTAAVCPKRCGGLYDMLRSLIERITNEFSKSPDSRMADTGRHYLAGLGSVK